ITGRISRASRCATATVACWDAWSACSRRARTTCSWCGRRRSPAAAGTRSWCRSCRGVSCSAWISRRASSTSIGNGTEAMRIQVVSLFPEMVRTVAEYGVVGRAVKQGLLELGYENPRDYATDPHRTVDDRPYGGGPGMVLKYEP